MISLYRASSYNNPTAPSFAGRSIDTKPTNVANGSRFTEIDTGRKYCFDAENKKWYEMPVGGI